MRILYLDTSSSFLYAGLVEDNKLLISIEKDFGKNLSTYTLNEIKEMFDKVNLSPSDVNKIIAVNGPGSFTGIRIGLTIAKTYAWGLNKKITTISSLEAMALSATGYDYYIPVIDARRGFVYAGIYDKDYNVVLSDRYINFLELEDKVNSFTGSKVIITNNNIKSDVTAQKYEPDILKIVSYCKDRASINPHSVDALYLKLTEAEENKMNRVD